MLLFDNFEMSTRNYNRIPIRYLYAIVTTEDYYEQENFEYTITSIEYIFVLILKNMEF